MDDCISILVEYFKSEVPRLGSVYSWKIPKKIAGFPYSGKRGYGPNVELKCYFNRRWLESDAQARYELSKEVVVDWGGVRANKEETLRSYVDELGKESPAMPLKGVASYSKLYSIANMDKYAIYDARVAACLNAVQWNFGTSSGVAFNYVSGRNNIVGHAGKKAGFVYQEPFKVRSLVGAGWRRVSRDDTYGVYLNVLERCLTVLPGYKLYELEMVLFANAERECLKAMRCENN
ncbi:hypothetical protein LPB260_16455 [Pseudomonas sp. LPB0260]|uniref:hypothetical protein n=1 Tax=Pseudomonas sp. LPB0260 TaxID=2614442 RepID=UPI0015C2AD02|nr:hypothetical protein [Pseudomonas sp. LPB0260]QLC72368.1 hypothetical protein LPB260_01505 [Pseudomonas sp. LPB0260]QLC75144.1 hypothetical protein LPB260_16455 [Pseudomonas sp. LPB0260]